MARISDLSDELLIKILTYLPTKFAVSTSILSKQWEFLWMWLPKLEFDDYTITDDTLSSFLSYRDFINKNLPLHRSPVIESLLLRFRQSILPQPEKFKQWVEIAVSRFLRELSVDYYCFIDKPHDALSLPSCAYTCNSLTTLKLQGGNVLVDVPPTVCLPSLKTLQLRFVAYLDEDSLRLLLSSCPVLEDLLVELKRDYKTRVVNVNIPSLQRLSLWLVGDVTYFSEGYAIVTPSLKYLKIVAEKESFPYMIEPMPKLEEADIDVVEDVEKILESITFVRHLSLRPLCKGPEESVYPTVGIVFNQLEHLKLCICRKDWSKLLIWLLESSPKLRVLNLYVDRYSKFKKHERVIWKNEESSVPECLLSSLETFEFTGFMGTREERDFLSFFFKQASCLKSTSIIDRKTQLGSKEF